MGVQEGYTGGTVGVHWGYIRGTEGVQEGYTGGTLGVQWGYSRGTEGVQEGYRGGTGGVPATLGVSYQACAATGDSLGSRENCKNLTR